MDDLTSSGTQKIERISISCYPHYTFEFLSVRFGQIAPIFDECDSPYQEQHQCFRLCLMSCEKYRQSLPIHCGFHFVQKNFAGQNQQAYEFAALSHWQHKHVAHVEPGEILRQKLMPVVLLVRQARPNETNFISKILKKQKLSRSKDGKSKSKSR